MGGWYYLMSLIQYVGFGSYSCLLVFGILGRRIFPLNKYNFFFDQYMTTTKFLMIKYLLLKGLYVFEKEQ
jgi:hypothetical protein